MRKASISAAHCGRLLSAITQQEATHRLWAQLNELIGAADGKKFRNYAQQTTLDVLLGYASRHLNELSRRYRLQRISDTLALMVVDQDMDDELRSVHSLSGGESFLVSLSSNRVRVESLFIDEGFGSLDANTLRIAMNALDGLQAMGRKVGADALIRLAKVLHVGLDDLVFGEGDRGPDDDLRLQFEALAAMSPEEKHVAKSVLEAMIVKNQVAGAMAGTVARGSPPPAKKKAAKAEEIKRTAKRKSA